LDCPVSFSFSGSLIHVAFGTDWRSLIVCSWRYHISRVKEQSSPVLFVPVVLRPASLFFLDVPRFIKRIRSPCGELEIAVVRWQATAKDKLRMDGWIMASRALSPWVPPFPPFLPGGRA
jgi:hypothetical protein